MKISKYLFIFPLIILQALVMYYLRRNYSILFTILLAGIALVEVYFLVKFVQYLLNTKHKEVQDKIFESAKEIFKNNNIAHVISYELTIIYYALFPFKKFYGRKKEVSYHKGGNNIYAILLGLTVFELVIVHMVLTYKGYTVIAWIITIITLYFSMFLLAHIRARKNRKIYFGNDALFLFNGIYSKTKIPFDEIHNIRCEKYVNDAAKDEFNMNLFDDMEEVNVLLEANSNFSIMLPYGKSKNVKKIYFYVNNAEEFIQEIESIRA